MTLEGFQIFYAYNGAMAGSLVTAISISAAAAATSANMSSIIRDVWIYGPDRAIAFLNCYEWTVDNCFLEQHFTTGITVDGANFPNAGDWTICNSKFLSGSTVTCTHVALLASAGGFRIVNNKFNTAGSGNTTYAIAISPTRNYSGGYNYEPFLIAANSIEGLTVGIYFFGGNPDHTGSATQGAITGNQIWCVTCILATPTASNGMWVSGVIISGNTFTGIPPSVGVETNILQLDGIQYTSIAANVFFMSSGTGKAITIGAHTALIAHRSNQFDPTRVTLGTVATTPTWPASTVTKTNTFGHAMMVSIYQGTGTAVSVGTSSPVTSTQVLNQASGPFNSQFILNPGDTIAVTYTVTPNWTWRAVNP